MTSVRRRAQALTVPAFAVICALVVARPSVAQPVAVTTIGGERNVGAELGEVQDLALLPRHLVVLERSAPHLKVFGLDGRLHQTIGRTGSGPGEYRVPFALAYNANRARLHVVDPANQRVTTYAVGDTLQLAETMQTDVVNLVDLCVIDRRLLGLTRSGPQMVRELVAEGGKLVARRSYGAPRTGHPLAAHPMLRGYIGYTMRCDPAANAIYVISRHLGEVHILSAATGQQQTIPMQGFVPLRMDAIAGGGLRLSLPEHGFYESLLGSSPASEGIDIVVSRHEKGDDIAAYALVHIDRSGTQGPRRVQRWQQADAQGQLVACFMGDPYPAVALFRAAACP